MRLTVNTQPPGASVYVDNVKQPGKVTPCEVDLDLGADKTRRVEIATELPGYKTAVRAVTLLSGNEVQAPLIALVKNDVPVPAPAVVPAAPAIPQSPVLPPNGRVKINPVDGAEMFFVPAGEFAMGNDTGWNTHPRHKVYLDGYWIYRTPVTVGMYRRFCAAVKRDMPDPPEWKWFSDSLPVVNVTWFEANEYCSWAGVQLPTEAQWEKAARGPAGLKWPWGNLADPAKMPKGNGYGQLLGQLDNASPYGCLDMVGMVWEWCSDWHDAEYYARSPYKNPPGSDHTFPGRNHKVMRGCLDTWGRNQNMEPEHMNNNIGFRPVSTRP